MKGTPVWVAAAIVVGGLLISIAACGAGAGTPPPSAAPVGTAGLPPTMTIPGSPEPATTGVPSASPSHVSPAMTGHISVRVVAYVHCSAPPTRGAPACPPVAVDGATVVVVDAAGTEVARGDADENGMVRFEVPPGRYTLSGLPHPGTTVLPAPQTIDVAAGEASEATLSYDWVGQ